jgi:hypothetical protein
VRPQLCRRCQHPLSEEDSHPQRHQVSDIPPLQPLVTEYQLRQLVCQICEEATQAELPRGVPPGGFGPRVRSIAALCTGRITCPSVPPRISCMRCLACRWGWKR